MWWWQSVGFSIAELRSKPRWGDCASLPVTAARARLKGAQAAPGQLPLVGEAPAREETCGTEQCYGAAASEVAQRQAPGAAKTFYTSINLVASQSSSVSSECWLLYPMAISEVLQPENFQ